MLSVTIVCILPHNKKDTATWLTRDKELEQLKGSDGEVSSAKDSVYRGEGIVGYLPEAVGFSLSAAEGHGALDLDGNDQEEDSSIVWADERLEEDSMSDSGK